MTHRVTALPFRHTRSEDEMTSLSVTTTRETIDGLLKLERDRLVIQWRKATTTELVGNVIRKDREFDDVREVAVPLASVAGAHVRTKWFFFHKIVLTASDLRAFEVFAGEDGIGAPHPAELELGIRRRDRLTAMEFAAELALAIAERGLGSGTEAPAPPPPGSDGPRSDGSADH